MMMKNIHSSNTQSKKNQDPNQSLITSNIENSTQNSIQKTKKKICKKNKQQNHQILNQDKASDQGNLMEQHDQEKKVCQQFLLRYFEILSKIGLWEVQGLIRERMQKWRKFMDIRNGKISKMLGFLLYYYDMIVLSGGFIQVISKNELDQIIQKIIQKTDYILPKARKIFFNIYKLYLLPYQLYQKQFIHHKIHLHFTQIKRFNTPQSYHRLYHHKSLPNYSYLFENFITTHTSILTIQYIYQKYPDSKINTLFQTSNIYDKKFRVYQQGQMTIKQYFEFQQKKQNSNENLSIQNIQIFGIQFNLSNKPDIIAQIFKLIQNYPNLGFQNKDNALSYLDSYIIGTNIPKIYFTSKQSWIGAHQQTLSLSSVDINHGPDEAQWMILDFQYVQKFKQIILKQQNIDIYEQESLWFQKAEFMICRNIPIKKIIQKKGDLIYKGGGDMIWFKSKGVSMHSKWNIFPKSVEQIFVCRKRFEIDKKYNKKIPLGFRSLCYHKSRRFPKQLEILIKKWKQQQQHFINTDPYFLNIQTILKPKTDQNSFCQNCHSQIFNYYYQKQNSIICIQCIHNNKPLVNINSIFIKYKLQDIQNLLQLSSKSRLSLNCEYQGQVQGLCEGNFVGEVDYCSKKYKSIQAGQYFEDINIKMIVNQLKKYDYYISESMILRYEKMKKECNMNKQIEDIKRSQMRKQVNAIKFESQQKKQQNKKNQYKDKQLFIQKTQKIYNKHSQPIDFTIKNPYKYSYPNKSRNYYNNSNQNLYVSKNNMPHQQIQTSNHYSKNYLYIDQYTYNNPYTPYNSKYQSYNRQSMINKNDYYEQTFNKNRQGTIQRYSKQFLNQRYNKEYQYQ